MQNNFQACLAVELLEEGGYSNNPKDPGGATMQGITQRVYDQYRVADGEPPADVKDITPVERDAIYRAQYWVRMNGDALPTGVDLAVFDYAVNSGVNRAVEDLQRVVGCNVDGIVGMGTLSALANRDAVVVVNDLCDRRLRFLKSLKTWKDFGNGWRQRVARIKIKAGAMASPLTVAMPAAESPAAPKAPQSQQALTKTAEGAGLTSAAVGTAGQTLMTTAQQVQPHIGETIIGRAAFGVFLLLLGIGGLLVGYSYLRRIKEAGGLSPFIAGFIK